MTLRGLNRDRSEQPGDAAPVVVIAGMHRSGTSVVASMCRASGLFIGERLMPGNSSNVAGHFEDLDFYELHRRALEANGCSADGFTCVPRLTMPDILAAETERLVATRGAMGVAWGWKDPRTTLFLDFWLSRIPRAKFLFVFRSPWEVVDSLYRRGDGAFQSNPSFALAVWKHYNQSVMEFAARNPERSLVREIGQIAAEPGSFSAWLSEWLGVSLHAAYDSHPGELFVPSRLSRVVEPWRIDLVERTDESAVALYQRLQELAGVDPFAGQPAVHRRSVSDSQAGFIEWAATRRCERMLQEAVSSREQSQQVVGQRVAEIAAKQAALEAAERSLGEARDTIASLQAAASNQEAIAESLHRQITEQSIAREALHGAETRLRLALEQQGREADSMMELGRSLRTAQDRIASLEDWANRQDVMIESLARQVAERARGLDDLREKESRLALALAQQAEDSRALQLAEQSLKAAAERAALLEETVCRHQATMQALSRHVSEQACRLADAGVIEPLLQAVDAQGAQVVAVAAERDAERRRADLLAEEVRLREAEVVRAAQQVKIAEEHCVVRAAQVRKLERWKERLIAGIVRISPSVAADCDADALDAAVSEWIIATVERDAQLQRITRSRSWRYTRPLRAAARVAMRCRQRIVLWRERMGGRALRVPVVFREEGLAGVFRRTLRLIRLSWGRRLAAQRLRRASLSSAGVHLPASSSACAGVSASRDEQPLVSFVIPIYDRTDMVRTAVRSALAQTYGNIEVILVTDGSPEETMRVVGEFRGDSRVRVFSFPTSSGTAVRGRNKGIKEARGKYIAFLDSDDIASQDRVSVCVPLLESGAADVVYGSWKAVVDGSRAIDGIVDGQVVFSPEADAQQLLNACVPCQSTVMARKSVFDIAGALKPGMRYREDHELWARLAYFGARFKSVPQVLAHLRLHSGNNELAFKANDSFWERQVRSEYTRPGPHAKKIAFIVPGVGISGGIAVVIRHAAMLMDAGHDAFLINVGAPGDAAWFPHQGVPIVHIEDPRSYLCEGLDLLIATGWSTVEWLDRIPAARRLYFVQSDERRFVDSPEQKRVIGETYRTRCEYITEAHWIRAMLRDEFGHDAAYVPNGIDRSMFYPAQPIRPRTPGRLRVLLEGPICIPFKGMADAYAAVAGLDCEIWIVSAAGKPPSDWKYDRFFEAVPFEDMKHIYSACDIFLKMSRVEGFFGPPMEAMACGCAVVVGKVTGYDEYIVAGRNALVVGQGDVAAARTAVQRLLADDRLRDDLVKGGFVTVADWSWDRSARAMLAVVDAARAQAVPAGAASQFVECGEKAGRDCGEP